MKNCNFALLATALTLSSYAQADTVLGVHAGADFWRTSSSGGFANTEQQQAFNFDKDSQYSYYVAFEHFVPVLPNLRIQYNKLETQGPATLDTDFNFAGEDFSSGNAVQAGVDLSSVDYVLYYEILDNALVSLDLGVNAKHLKGDITVRSDDRFASERVSQWLPMLYADAKVGILATGFDVFASGSATAWKDSHLYDFQAGIGYQLVDNMLIDVRVKVGYRVADLQLDDIDGIYSDLDFKGVFAGVHVHF